MPSYFRLNKHYMAYGKARKLSLSCTFPCSISISLHHSLYIIFLQSTHLQFNKYSFYEDDIILFITWIGFDSEIQNSIIFCSKPGNAGPQAKKVSQTGPVIKDPVKV